MGGNAARLMRWRRRAGWAALALLLLPAAAAALIWLALPGRLQPSWRGYTVHFVYPLSASVGSPQAAWVLAPEPLFVSGEIAPLVLLRGRWLVLQARLHNASNTLQIPLVLNVNWRGAVHAKLPHAAPLRWPHFSIQGISGELSSRFLDHGVRWSLVIEGLQIPPYASVRQVELDFGLAATTLHARDVRLTQPARAPLAIAEVRAQLDSFGRSDEVIGVRSAIQLRDISSREFAATTVDLNVTIEPLDATVLTLQQLAQRPASAALWQAAAVLGPTVLIKASASERGRLVHGALALRLAANAPLKPLHGTVDVDGDYGLARRSLAAVLAFNAGSDAAQREAQGRAVDLLERAEKAAWLTRSDESIALHMRWEDGVLAPQSVR